MKFTPTSRTIAGEVRAEMARQGVKATQLAESIGMSLPTLRRRLNGSLPFDTDELTRVADALEVPPTEFYVRAAA